MSATALVVSFVLATVVAASPSDLAVDAKGDGFDLQAIDVSADGSVYRPRNVDGSPASVEFRRMPASICFTQDFPTSLGQVGACALGESEGVLVVACEADQVALDPIFKQTWVNNPDGTISGLSRWELQDPAAPGDCVAAVDLAALAEAEFQRLTIAPSPVTIQPPDGWTLVNVDTITYTSPAPQTFSTTLLGIPVTIEATPDAFTWDYDDGSTPVTTTDPGRAYPHHTVAHVYEEEAVATITLATTWHGRFQITGTATWTPITGTATTTTTAPPLTIHEARTRLVTEPLD
ncbi:hypothetical protein [Oerskovia turbata]|uniref:hypothetical protein n=2 Tax=Oerskovia turbata TaxID=1713 RepID=UPI0013E93975|nr:hypothetical protein [Oerskovia turbata]